MELSQTFTRSAITLAAVLVVSAALVGQQGQAPAAATPARPSPSPSGLGRAPSPAELRAWGLSVGPTGAELPAGSGTVAQGAVVFTQRRCAECHGPTGKEGPAPILVGEEYKVSMNIFPIAYWPFAPTVFDYIRRAMPYDRPGRLTPDEVYAVLAFLLNRNGIVPETAVLDAKTLPQVQMPHRSQYTVPPAWTPDTRRGFSNITQ